MTDKQIVPRPRPAADDLASFRAAAQAVAAAAEQLERAAELAVRARRLQGQSWAEIGRAFGITKQAAHKKWKHLDGPVAVCVGDAGAHFVCPSTGLRWRNQSELRLIARVCESGRPAEIVGQVVDVENVPAGLL